MQPSVRHDASLRQEGPQRRGAGHSPATQTQARGASSGERQGPIGTVPEAGGERLNKYLARAGVCSRREADAWVEKGWVHINGQPAQMGQKVMPGDRVEVRHAATRQQQERVTILMNKPVGYVSGQAEDGYRPAASLIEAASRWPEDRSPRRFDRNQLRGLAAAGRLDIDSTGLLVLTQDGRVARQLIGEDSEVSKEYLVRVRFGAHERNVQAVFPPEKLKLLRHGLSLDGKKLKPAEVEWQNPEQLRFVLHEGKHRQIRRMCELVGLHVTGLKRIRIGRVKLGHLPVGQWRYLGADEEF
ncbi:MAG: pseudouridine synthase [Lautropia sp.]|nr:pseudouridine synthase [Lautropia sp.]